MSSTKGRSSAAITCHWTMVHLLMLASLCIGGAQAFADLRCGAANVDVTPQELPVIQNGGFLQATANRVLDPLHARAIVFEDENTTLAIVVVDSCMIPTQVCDQIKAIASRQTGIRQDRILISATHTHTAPSVMDYCLGADADTTYCEYLIPRVADAIRLAHERLQPAKVGHAVVDASRFTKNRRWITRTDKLSVDPFGERTIHAMMHPGHANPDFVGPSGPIDPWMTVLCAESLDGQPIAILANFSMHYFGGHAGISADYFGQFAVEVEQELGGESPDFVAVMSQGTSGDLWWGDYNLPRDQQAFSSHRQFAEELSELALQAIREMDFESGCDLAMQEQRVTLGRRLPNEERLAWARRLNALRGDRAPKDRPEVYARQAVYLHENPTDEVVLQAIRIGDFAITGIPNEVYALTGLKLKRQSPLETTMNISLANGATGYIPPPEQHALGGYNTWPARTAGLEVQAENKIVNRLLGMLETVSNAKRRVYREPPSELSEQIERTKPYAYWRLDEQQGPVARDSLRGHELIANGQVAYHLPGQRVTQGANAYDTHAFHLAGGTLSCDTLALGESYSIEFCFWLGTPTDFRETTAALFTRGQDQLRITGKGSSTPGKLAFGKHVGNSEIEPRRWYHLVFTRNGDFIEVCLNKAEPEIAARVGRPEIGAPTQVIFGGGNSSRFQLEGKLDEIAVYDRALTRDILRNHFVRASSDDAGTNDPEPKSPEDSLKAIHVRDGFEVQLVASEPMVVDPVAIDWSLDGKLWVAEMSDYPNGMDGKGKAGGRVRYLEDTDGDGRYDRSNIFLENLSFPNGVMAWGDGVLVTAAPEIFLARDTDGDGIADYKETLLSGFVEGNQQLRVNGLRLGLDGWVYCASGAHHAGFGAKTKIHSTKLQKDFAIGSHDFRFRPETGEVELISGPSQYGRVRDDYGNWFGVQNSQPLWHFVLPYDKMRRNDKVSSIDPRKQLRTPIPPRVFTAKPPQKRFHGFDHAGHYTSACGICIYRDEVLFTREQTHAFTCEPFHNLVQHHVLTREGTSFTGQRGDDGPIDFFASTDRWTRPVMARTGPDGALWIVDMYRYIIEHPHWLPKAAQDEIRSVERLGDNRGRIYRIVRRVSHAEESVVVSADESTVRAEFASKGGQASIRFRMGPDLGDGSGWTLDPLTLVDLLKSPNGIVRDMAQLALLAESRLATLLRSKAAGSLEELVSSDSPVVQLQALSTLLAAGHQEIALKSLQGVAKMAPSLKRALMRFSPLKAMTFASDDDPAVRLQAALSLGDVSGAAAGEALWEIAARSDNDPYTLAAIGSSMPSHVRLFHRRAIHDLRSIQPEIFATLLALVRNDASLHSELILAMAGNSQEERTLQLRLRRIGQWFTHLENQNESFAKYLKHEDRSLRLAAKKVAQTIGQARDLLQTEGTPVPLRVSAIALLGREAGYLPVDCEILAECLSITEAPEIRDAALSTLMRLAPKVAFDVLADSWESLSSNQRLRAVDFFLQRTSTTATLLEALETKSMIIADLSLAQLNALMNSSDPETARRVKRLISPADSERSRVVTDYAQSLHGLGEVERGRQLFLEHCKVCHSLDESVRRLGPDLRALTDRDPRNLLVAILDPSQTVDPRYLSYTAVLEDGSVRNGLIQGEDAGSIKLVTQNGETHVLLRETIEAMKRAQASFMPNGFERLIKPEEMADLIAYLRSL
jgi:putative membrane-bound dehydrogenase-like protein